MKFADLFSLATRMFKNKPLRTFLTVLGVGVGIGTVLFLVSFGYGLQRIILNRITTADSLLSLDVSPAVSEVVALSDQTVSAMSLLPEVAEVSRLSTFSSQISMSEDIADSVVYAIDPSFFRLSGIVPETGKTIVDPTIKEAVVSSALAKLFNLNSDETIGKTIDLELSFTEKDAKGNETIITSKQSQFKIVGVVEDESASYAYVPMGSLAGVSISRFDQVKIKAKNTQVVESLRNNLIDKGFIVSSLSDTIDEANKIFKIVQIVLFLFGFVALIVSAIGMFNTMTIALLEKTNEIGIMRSVGITAKDIKRIFLMEASIMGFLGGLGGVFIGILTGKLVNFALNILASNFGGKPVDVFYSPTTFILLIVVFSGVVGFATGVYPSIRAAKINPLEALRYK